MYMTYYRMTKFKVDPIWQDLTRLKMTQLKYCSTNYLDKSIKRAHAQLHYFQPRPRTINPNLHNKEVKRTCVNT